MKMYKVLVSWEMAGYFCVEAEDEIDAEQQVYDSYSIPEGDYVQGSFTIEEVEEIK